VRKLLPATVLWSAMAATAPAQCVMCFRTAKAQNQERSRVMNLGILLLGGPPFLILAGFIGYVFRRDRVNEGDE
jgi:hypothetical protein